METHDIHPVSVYKYHITLSSNKYVAIKNRVPSASSKINDPPQKISSPITHINIGTKVAFSIEKDLHIIVTRVKDSNTNKVIRQIPPEETIDRLKLLNNYYKQPIDNVVKFQPKYI
ncbi:MAG: hypothetical protein E3K36_04230 [Candidatus Brocadia sp.]|nr:hypothetical protein [Candidatus Brocadia sp.]